MAAPTRNDSVIQPEDKKKPLVFDSQGFAVPVIWPDQIYWSGFLLRSRRAGIDVYLGMYQASPLVAEAKIKA